MSIQSHSPADTEANRKIKDEIIAYMAEHQTEIMESLGFAVRSGNWLAENSKQVTHDHPNQWIAVRETAVVAHAPDLDTLHTKLEAKHLNRSEVLIRFMEDPPLRLKL